MYYKSSTVDSIASGQPVHMHLAPGGRCVQSPDGSTFLRETRSRSPSWKYGVKSKIRLRQSTRIYLENNPAIIIHSSRSDLQQGNLRLFWRVSPQQEQQRDECDKRSVPDQKILATYVHASVQLCERLSVGDSQSHTSWPSSEDTLDPQACRTARHINWLRHQSWCVSRGKMWRLVGRFDRPSLRACHLTEELTPVTLLRIIGHYRSKLIILPGGLPHVTLDRGP